MRDFEPPLRIRGASGGAIESLGDWEALAPPGGRGPQWREGRPAFELARTWLRSGRPALPEELAALMASLPDTADLAAGLVQPAFHAKLDAEPRGDIRSVDVLVCGRAAGQRTLVTVGGTADAPHGLSLGRALEAASPQSQVNVRVPRLVTLLFGPGRDVDAAPYGLVHDLAATVLEAQRREAEQAVFAVQAFGPEDVVDASFRAVAALVRFLSPHPFERGRLQRVRVEGAPELPVFLGFLA